MAFVTFKYLKIVLQLFVVLVEKSLSVKCRNFRNKPGDWRCDRKIGRIE